MFRSLSVRTVIGVNVIAPVNVVIKPGLNRVNGRGENTSPPGHVASKMPLDNNGFVTAAHKK